MAYHSSFNFCDRIIEQLWLDPTDNLEVAGRTFDQQLKDCTGSYTSTIEVAKQLEEKAQRLVEKKLQLPSHWDLADLQFHAELADRAATFYKTVAAVAESIRGEVNNSKVVAVPITMDELERLCEEGDSKEKLDDLVVEGDGDIPEGFVRV